MADENSIKIEDFKTDLLTEIESNANNMDRTNDKGIVNSKTGSSIRVSENGDTSLVAGERAQYKLQIENGNAVEISYQSHTITNRKNISADEVVLNNHKFNNQLYELSDLRKLFDDDNKAIGNLTLSGTVLVKTWDENLKKFVLIRRQIRTPMFSPLLNTAVVPEGLSLEAKDPLE